ncbi:MAG: hypothetical protein U5N58_11700 [Actinomycetota bacterium]|nr:hypothetical protein [Actinomycetota bacterium]
MNTRPHLKYDDISWAMFRFEDGSFAVIENNWSLPDNVPYAINAGMEVLGDKGMISIDNSGQNFTMVKEEGVSYPEARYWPVVHGARRGFLKEELDYFVKCILKGEKPNVITAQESRDVVNAIRLAEKSAKENKVIYF